MDTGRTKSKRSQAKNLLVPTEAVADTIDQAEEIAQANFFFCESRQAGPLNYTEVIKRNIQGLMLSVQGVYS